MAPATGWSPSAPARGLATKPRRCHRTDHSHRILAQLRPDILVLTPRDAADGTTGPAESGGFHAPWEHDASAGSIAAAALNQPLKPGSRSSSLSSGAAENDRRRQAATAAPSAWSGSWPNTPTASGEERLGIRSRRSCRGRWSSDRVGDADGNAYSRTSWREARRVRSPLRRADAAARVRPEKIVSVLDDQKYADGLAFGFKGGAEVTMLEAAAA